MAGLIYPNGAPVTSRDVQRARASASAASSGGFANAYDAAERSGAWTSNWRPALRSPDADWLPNRDITVARARDVARNDTVGAAAISRRKNSAVGKGWRLSSRPNARALGITPEAARELAQAIETEFNAHAYGHAFEIDATRRMNLGGQLRLAFHHLMADGEGVGLAEWAANEDTRYKTRLRIIDPDRLSNPNGKADDSTFRGGIEHDAAEVPIRYWFRQAHPGDFISASKSPFIWNSYERFTAWGRPQVFHWFEVERAGQSRGVTRFVSALKSFRALSRFTDATLQNATVNALLAAFVQSSAGPEAVSQDLNVGDLVDFDGQRTEYYDDNPVMLGGDVRVPVLPFGDEIKMATAARDVTAFDAFVRAIIRLIASSLGVTYEEISMDYSQTNYSSARAALIHAAAETEATMALIEAQLVKPYFVAWLEEAFDRGYVAAPEGAPDFYDAIDAYAEARWIGPKRGYIDPTKEILAAAGRIELGISTLEREAADQGEFWQDVIDQRAIELAYLKDRGLEMYDTGLSLAVSDNLETAPPANVAPEDARPSDEKPAEQKNAKRTATKVHALGAMARFANSADHERFLDARIAA